MCASCRCGTGRSFDGKKVKLGWYIQYVSKETLVKVEKSNKKAQKSKKNPL